MYCQKLSPGILMGIPLQKSQSLLEPSGQLIMCKRVEATLWKLFKRESEGIGNHGESIRGYWQILKI